MVNSCRLSIVRSMSLSAAVWPQFVMQVSRTGSGSLGYIRIKLCKVVSNYVYVSGVGNKMFETS